MGNEMKGKYCLVTGATSGIGKEIALGLVGSGANVVLVCRDMEKGRMAFEDIKKRAGRKPGGLLLAELSSQGQVRNLAAQYKDEFPALHVLVNNAGTAMDKKVLTEDGVETTFAVNYLAYFLLTNLLVDLLINSAPARIVNVASQVHRAVSMDLNNLQGEKRFNRDYSYAQSKLADILFTYELGRRLEGTGVTANCVCPGAVATRMWRTSSEFMDTIFKVFMKGPVEGAKIPLYLATAPELQNVSCRYFQTNQHLKYARVYAKNAMCRSSRETYDTELAGKLWEISKKLTGLDTTI